MGGSSDDDDSEFVRACEALCGLGGSLPSDWWDEEVCKRWSCPPSVMRRESAWDVERTLFKIRVERQADADREANQKAARQHE